MVIDLDRDGLMERTWLTPREAAGQVHVSVKTVYAWVDRGLVEVVRHDRVSRNGPSMMIELESLLDCEAAMRKGKMGRPRAGTERGRA